LSFRINDSSILSAINCSTTILIMISIIDIATVIINNVSLIIDVVILIFLIRISSTIYIAWWTLLLI